MEKRGVRRLLSAGLNRLRSREDESQGGARARVIAVAAQKGGVGKTTTTKSRLVGVSSPGIRTLPPKFDALLSRPFARTEVRQATGPLPKLPPR